MTASLLLLSLCRFVTGAARLCVRSRRRFRCAAHVTDLSCCTTLLEVVFASVLLHVPVENASRKCRRCSACICHARGTCSRFALSIHRHMVAKRRQFV